MSHPFTIRQAEGSDVPAVVELWEELAQLHADIRACFATAPDARECFGAFLQEHLLSEQSVVWVAAACPLAAAPSVVARWLSVVVGPELEVVAVR